MTQMKINVSTSFNGSISFREIERIDLAASGGYALVGSFCSTIRKTDPTDASRVNIVASCMTGRPLVAFLSWPPDSNGNRWRCACVVPVTLPNTSAANSMTGVGTVHHDGFDLSFSIDSGQISLFEYGETSCNGATDFTVLKNTIPALSTTLLKNPYYRVAALLATCTSSLPVTPPGPASPAAVANATMHVMPEDHPVPGGISRGAVLQNDAEILKNLPMPPETKFPIMDALAPENADKLRQSLYARQFIELPRLPSDFMWVTDCSGVLFVAPNGNGLGKENTSAPLFFLDAIGLRANELDDPKWPGLLAEQAQRLNEIAMILRALATVSGENLIKKAQKENHKKRKS